MARYPHLEVSLHFARPGNYRRHELFYTGYKRVTGIDLEVIEQNKKAVLVNTRRIIFPVCEHPVVQHVSGKYFSLKYATGIVDGKLGCPIPIFEGVIPCFEPGALTIDTDLRYLDSISAFTMDKLTEVVGEACEVNHH